jgi:cytochrome c553
MWSYKTSHGIITVVLVLVMMALPVLAQTPADGGFAAGKIDGDRDGQGSALWGLAGLCLGCIGILVAYLVKPTPPSASLVGKSSEYVSAYTEAYKAKGAKNNAMWAAIGCLVSGIPSCIVGIINSGAIIAAITSLFSGGGS